ncbi:MAG: ACP S-malonyltransferase [Xanthomonadales bacterium]|nr:ACP S-malonyltransferase [Xanthomonadales bacterium]
MKSFAFLFPGQGSQSIGMMQGLASDPVVRTIFDDASSALEQDLWSLVENGPEEQLNRTENTQPVMLAAGIAAWRCWRERGGPEPGVLAGHSLGEYSALVAAGAMDFADAVRIVRLRGRAMQTAAPEGSGAMAAVLGLADEVLADVCSAAAGNEIVSCANFNAPGQVVIAGHAAAVDRACAMAADAGARRAIRLPVSVPSHCLLMKPAAEQLEAALKDVRVSEPNIPVIHNADVRGYSDPDAIRDALVRQLWQPVRWTETIRHLVAQGYGCFGECGPGKVLAGLNRRIDRDVDTHALTDEAAMDALREMIGS